MAKLLYQVLASTVQARLTCGLRRDGFTQTTEKEGNKAQTWFDRHEDTINRLVRGFMPSGSGFDNGTKIDLDASHADKLVFHTSYHHMNDGGYYDGWTEHIITVTPSLAGEFHLRISGRDRRDIKEYIAEEFQNALGMDVEWELWEPYVNVGIQRHEDIVSHSVEWMVTTYAGKVLATCADYEKAKAFAVEYVKAHRDETRKVEVLA